MKFDSWQASAAAAPGCEAPVVEAAAERRKKVGTATAAAPAARITRALRREVARPAARASSSNRSTVAPRSPLSHDVPPWLSGRCVWALPERATQRPRLGALPIVHSGDSCPEGAHCAGWRARGDARAPRPYGLSLAHRGSSQQGPKRPMTTTPQRFGCGSARSGAAHGRKCQVTAKGPISSRHTGTTSLRSPPWLTTPASTCGCAYRSTAQRAVWDAPVLPVSALRRTPDNEPHAGVHTGRQAGKSEGRHGAMRRGLGATIGQHGCGTSLLYRDRSARVCHGRRSVPAIVSRL